nr:MAG TPA: hypothetical protein [Caudoviricetes sp.]
MLKVPRGGSGTSPGWAGWWGWLAPSPSRHLCSHP